MMGAVLHGIEVSALPPHQCSLSMYLYFLSIIRLRTRISHYLHVAQVPFLLWYSKFALGG